PKARCPGFRTVLEVAKARVRAAESSCSPWAQFRIKDSTRMPPGPVAARMMGPGPRCASGRRFEPHRSQLDRHPLGSLTFGLQLLGQLVAFQSEPIPFLGEL